MNKVEFSVGAKAARLIGRENIADVDGALIELIKNSYDADASCVLVRFYIPFLDVPNIISIGYMKDILSLEDFNKVNSYYSMLENGDLEKKDLSEDEELILENILNKYNRIIIADNGTGMSYDKVTSSWMYIGTSDKENNYISAKGRIKTGAKGIGRFALDKLSRISKMYTKLENSDKTIFWAMDWDQFLNVKLISDVKADIDELEISYKDYVYKYFFENSKLLNDYDWSHGTLIELSPTREFWSKRLFKKVNTNLRSINPIGSVDRFDVVILNDLYPEFYYKTDAVAIDSDDYDYRIKIHFDGNECLRVSLFRNEVDLSITNVYFEKFGEIVEKETDEFWNRNAFLIDKYHKQDYDKEIILDYKVQDILPNDSILNVKKVGSFDAELYFMRLDNGDKYPIMKNVIRKRRADIRSKFSGIKIYRDSFKVRPYGDEGSLFDWLGLSSRVQKSPAGVANLDSSWRVEPYQMIGWVSIGRERNPLLEDMANREGLALNDYYYIFCDLIKWGIGEFEFDRQYVYREYSKWKKEIEEEISSRHTNERVIEVATNRKGIGNNYIKDNDTEKQDSLNFSEEDYLNTVQQLVEESDQKLNEKQILQILSSSGIILNTFFHEFNAINTQFHVEAPQIRSRVRYILNNEEYTGIPAYNPYPRLDALEKNDKLTAAFLDVVMEGLKKENLKNSEISLKETFNSIIHQWTVLLKEKHIDVDYSVSIDDDSFDIFKFAKVDLFIIINNFMLNSAWFLEESHIIQRKVFCILHVRENDLELILKNNGPLLDPKYRYNPNKIFEMGESTKEKKGKDKSVSEGTGLGLWILKEAVERNKGNVEVLDDNEGFSLKITIRR